VRFGTEEEQVLLMETAMKIRGWVLGDGRSIRAVARETGISRTTIKKYLKDPEQPQYRERQPRVGHKLNAQFEQRLRDLFKHDLQLRRRDRRTAKKLYEALVAEGYTGSYSPVQRFVSELKKSVASVRVMRSFRCISRQVMRSSSTGARNMSCWGVSSTRFMSLISACATAASLSSWPT
jgi:transposase